MKRLSYVQDYYKPPTLSMAVVPPSSGAKKVLPKQRHVVKKENAPPCPVTMTPSSNQKTEKLTRRSFAITYLSILHCSDLIAKLTLHSFAYIVCLCTSKRFSPFLARVISNLFYRRSLPQSHGVMVVLIYGNPKSGKSSLFPQYYFNYQVASYCNNNNNNCNPVLFTYDMRVNTYLCIAQVCT